MTGQLPPSGIHARAILALGLVLALCAVASHAAPLDALRWKSRIVLLFAAEPSMPALKAQRALLAGSEDAARDRDLLRIEVVGATLSATPPIADLPTAAALREQFKVGAADFVVLLIGKDGGIKLRAGEPLPACALYELIDGMSMRRSERHQDRFADPCPP